MKKSNQMIKNNCKYLPAKIPIDSYEIICNRLLIKICMSVVMAGPRVGIFWKQCLACIVLVIMKRGKKNGVFVLITVNIKIPLVKIKQGS